MHRVRSRVRRTAFGSQSIFISVLMASHLFVGCGVAAAEPPKEKRFSARIIAEIDVDSPRQYNGSEKWCYSAGGAPTFVFANHKTLFRYDVSGKLLFKYEANWLDDATDTRGAIGLFSCSRDGNTLWFVDDGNTRLVNDAGKYRLMMKARDVATTRPLPLVQRPGTAQNRGEREHAELRKLNARLSNSGDIKDAVALYNARKSGRG